MRSKSSGAAAAHGLFATGGTLTPDYKNDQNVRTFVASWAALGYTACIAVSPAHLATINEVMAVSEAEVASSLAICRGCEAAMDRD